MLTSRHALGGLALTALFLFGQGSSFAHRLVVQHAVCAEHGEAIHVESAEAVEAADGLEVRAAPAATDEHGHDHCMATLQRRDELECPAPFDGLIVRQAALPLEGIVAVASPLTSLELLSLAPKSSPPA